MSFIDDVRTRFTDIGTRLTAIEADIQRIKDQVANDADKTEVLASLDALLTRVGAIDDSTPEPVVEPPV